MDLPIQVQPRKSIGDSFYAHIAPICGLSNLGNTCYMNSGLQCLLHSNPLVQYLISEQIDEDIFIARVEEELSHKKHSPSSGSIFPSLFSASTPSLPFWYQMPLFRSSSTLIPSAPSSNPTISLSSSSILTTPSYFSNISQGYRDVATIVARFSRSFWRGGHTSLSPLSVKQAIASIAPQFRGSFQHDAHEFIMYLVDALHEGVKCKKKSQSSVLSSSSTSIQSHEKKTSKHSKTSSNNDHYNNSNTITQPKPIDKSPSCAGKRRTKGWKEEEEKEEEEKDSLKTKYLATDSGISPYRPPKSSPLSDNEKEWKRLLNNGNDTVIFRTCYGLLCNKLQCCRCGDIVKMYEPFSILSVPIPQQNISFEFFFVDSIHFKFFRVVTSMSTDSGRVAIKDLKLNCIEAIRRGLKNRIDKISSSSDSSSSSCNFSLTKAYFKSISKALLNNSVVVMLLDRYGKVDGGTILDESISIQTYHLLPIHEPKQWSQKPDKWKRNIDCLLNRLKEENRREDGQISSLKEGEKITFPIDSLPRLCIELVEDPSEKVFNDLLTPVPTSLNKPEIRPDGSVSDSSTLLLLPSSSSSSSSSSSCSGSIESSSATQSVHPVSVKTCVSESSPINIALLEVEEKRKNPITHDTESSFPFVFIIPPTPVTSIPEYVGKFIDTIKASVVNNVKHYIEKYLVESGVDDVDDVMKFIGSLLPLILSPSRGLMDSSFHLVQSSEIIHPIYYELDGLIGNHIRVCGVWKGPSVGLSWKKDAHAVLLHLFPNISMSAWGNILESNPIFHSFFEFITCGAVFLDGREENKCQNDEQLSVEAPITQLAPHQNSGIFYPSSFDSFDFMSHAEGVRELGIPSEPYQIPLDSCLKSFFSAYTCPASVGRVCSKCKCATAFTTSSIFARCPELLILHLKRFSHEGDGECTKIQLTVDFPVSCLDIGEFVEQGGKDGTEESRKKRVEYELYAVSQHYGGLKYGHYTALAKCKGEWYAFDDAYTHKVNRCSIVTAAAYVLFYRKKQII
ncbi:hypothetical protein ADUPG1_007869 [Aduncisulcus paluster]|uniref:USP domain-containing protein n=1 Tax=Aduncisulcus paluster TaxID=2918883 RepID=A0ABQ5KT19_9EUKA|nr:hypothetical protein ADUPG1_007869 [Aduncisulcus paluster]